ncbi:MAG: histidine phosphatase family protein [Deltaproteobacteria bacterium]|nr:histidine phosphatase family protein [Deltaproteobacteria bacterium]
MEKANRLYIVRHGQIIGHEKYPANGHTDVDITEAGRLQMEQLAVRLIDSEINVIYSSDLQRTKKGAGIIGRHHAVPYKSVSEFRELFFGLWEGLTMEEIIRDFPGELDKRKNNIADFRPPGNGESIRDLSERVIPRFMNMLRDEKGKNILLVGHGVVNRIILCHVLGIDLSKVFNIQQDYGCLNIIDYFPDHTLVRLING